MQGPSPVYQYVINLIVSLPIRRGPGTFVNVSVRKHCTFSNKIFGCGKVYYSNTIMITIFM
jgi:hypothetical protein